MKIYSILYNDDPEGNSLGWPVEWAYFGHDTPEHGYKEKDGDILVERYLCKVDWGNYYRLKLLRRYLCAFYETTSLEDFLRLPENYAVEYYLGQFQLFCGD